MIFDPALLAFLGATTGVAAPDRTRPGAGSAGAEVLGRIGGMTRRDNMTAEERSASARKAALSRWKKREACVGGCAPNCGTVNCQSYSLVLIALSAAEV